MNFKNIDELKTKLQEISKKHFIKSSRHHNTGIGKTLEDEMDIDENNLAEGDFKVGNGVAELKSQRKKASSRITLSTKEPEWLKNKLGVVKSTGYKDKKDRLALKITLTAKGFNKKGYKLEITDNKINIIHISEGKVCFFDVNKLMDIIKSKLGENLLFVLADVEKKDGKENFHYSEAIYYSNFYEEKFKDLIKEGKIIWEFRLHLKPSGAIRDHGSGFRISRKYLDELYENKIVLI